MGNKKYTFKFEPDESLELIGNCEDCTVYKVKLVGTDNSKEIKFYGPYFGSYGTFEEEDKKYILFFVHITNDTGEKAYLSYAIILESVEATVTFDNQCEYTIALSLKNNEWITLPKSSLLSTNNDNLKKYYNKKLNLSLIEGTLHIMYDKEKVCDLASISAPIYLKSGNQNPKITPIKYKDYEIEDNDWTDYRLIIETDQNNQLSVYLSDKDGNHIEENRIDNHSNIALKTALLESSNIREVLPELEIDDNVNLDTRQLKCWVNKESTIQKIAKDPTLQEGVAAKLREDPGNAKGEDGVSPDVREIVTKLITEKREEFGQMVLDATDSSGQNLATQVAGKVNFKPGDFVNKVDEASLTTGIVSKLTSAKAEEFVEKIVNTVISNIHKNNPNSPDFRQDERFAEKLAELLFDRSKMSTKGAENLIRQKVDKWGLAKYLLLHSGLHQEQEALKLTKEKLDGEILANILLELAGFQTRQEDRSYIGDENKARMAVEDIVDRFLSDQVIEKLVTRLLSKFMREFKIMNSSNQIKS